MSVVSRAFQDTHPSCNFSKQDLEDILPRTDKDLFIKFRDKQISYDQLVARVAERTSGIKYTVLDDIKDTLHPSIM